MGVYIPPGYTVKKGKECLQHVADLVLDFKMKLDDPYIIVMGDFNQWKIGDTMAEFPDCQEVISPPTRGNRRIDRTFVNFLMDVTRTDCLPPLETSSLDTDGRRAFSDHKIQVTSARIKRKEPTKWEEYSFRPYTEAGAAGFEAELAAVDWSLVTLQQGSNNKATSFQMILDDLMHKHFPWKTVRRKETDLPWFGLTARKMARKKKAVYRLEGRSDKWWHLREKLDAHLAVRQETFLAKQRDKFIGPEAQKHFYKNIKAFKNMDKPENFDVRTLRPGQTDQETADELAAYFNRISREFEPLQPHQIPCTYDRDIPPLSLAQVENMIRKSKKGSSMVAGDIFPKLLNPCSPYLSIPLMDIYNEILSTFVWPVSWKKEYVTVIPKKNLPQDFGDLRNISCTLKFGKIFEAHVLAYAKEEFDLKKNQYGGVKGCSTTHMVVEVLQEVCDNAEDYRTASVLAAIDYSKAFNRVSYQHCLDAYRRKGASSRIIRLIATFLTNRTMTVRVGNCWSAELDVTGGAPQGSIFGVHIFNTTTDDLEDDFLIADHLRLGLPIPDELGTGRADEIGSPQPGAAQTGQARTSSPNNAPPPPDALEVSPIWDRRFLPGGRHREFRPNVTNIPVANPTWIDPPEERAVGTQVLRPKPVLIAKYIDDNLSCEKLNFGDTPITYDEQGNKIKEKQAFGTQNSFCFVTTEANKRGMVVNADKTNLLCISDALTYKPVTYIHDNDGNTVNCGESLKVLGFTFSSKPTVDLHVTEVVRKMRRRKWLLTVLKKVGFNEKELVETYRSLILPLADYCAPAYHSMTTDEQDQEIERAQTGALRCIFGAGISGRKMRQKANMKTLRDRRVDLCDTFAKKCVANHRFQHWFPLTQGRRSARNKEIYQELPAKSDRLKNSPLFFMRRRLNGKVGKIYGERNRMYRENLNVPD